MVQRTQWGVQTHTRILSSTEQHEKIKIILYRKTFFRAELQFFKDLSETKTISEAELIPLVEINCSYQRDNHQGRTSDNQTHWSCCGTEATSISFFLFYYFILFSFMVVMKWLSKTSLDYRHKNMCFFIVYMLETIELHEQQLKWKYKANS